MSQVNATRAPAAPVYTHGGGRAVRGTPLAELRRTLLNCLLWEDNFYEGGVSVADRIKGLVPRIKAEDVFNLAIEARTDFGLRHAPLLVAREMARGTPEQRKLVPALLPAIINRPDEIAEFTSIYWADNGGKKFISHPIRRGFANALNKFNLFTLAKWDKKEKEVRIRDAMFMAHVKPHDLAPNAPKWSATERKADYKAGGVRAWPFTDREAVQFQVGQDLLKQEGTWEDRMSAGEKAVTVFTELMQEGKLGAMAFIRNVRKMNESGVGKELILTYSQTVKLRGVFPHQLIMSARINKQYEPMFDAMLLRCVAEMPKIAGKTIVLVDVSGSMDAVLSKNKGGKRYGSAPVEETTRIDAAAAVAIMAREVCSDTRVFTFSTREVEVPARRGMALRDAIHKSQAHAGTNLGAAVNAMARIGYDRLIVITDEQAQGELGKPLKGKLNYMINVAPYKNSVANAGEWEKIDGWSPAVIKFITQIEAEGKD